MNQVLARLEALSVSYRVDGRGRFALADIDLDIISGERLAVIGESGSGKSTLALALAGLLPDNALREGRIDWPGFGHDPAPGRDIGFVFQDPGASLNPVLTIGEQIAEVARQHLRLGWSAAFERARELLRRVRLPDPERAIGAYPHQLSGGQRQRVAIAAAIAAGPKLLIADEPTSALDTVVQARIVALLDELVGEDGMTLVFVTHDIALASGFADRIAVLKDAVLVESGDAAQVIGAPREDYTRSLVAGHIGLETQRLVAEAP